MNTDESPFKGSVVEIMDLENGETLSRTFLPVSELSTFVRVGPAAAPSEQRLLARSNKGDAVSVASLNQPDEVDQTVLPPDSIAAHITSRPAAFSGSGELLAVAGDRSIRVVEVSQWDPAASLDSFNTLVTIPYPEADSHTTTETDEYAPLSLSWIDDESRFVLIRGLEARENLQVWLFDISQQDVSSVKIAYWGDLGDNYLDIEFSKHHIAADAVYTAAVPDDEEEPIRLSFWEILDGTSAAVAASVGISQDIRRVVTPRRRAERFALVDPSKNRVQIWDAGSYQPLYTVGGSVGTDANAWIQDVAFRPDGEVLAIGYSNGTIDLWNLSQQAPELTVDLVAVDTVAREYRRPFTKH